MPRRHSRLSSRIALTIATAGALNLTSALPSLDNILSSLHLSSLRQPIDSLSSLTSPLSTFYSTDLSKRQSNGTLANNGTATSNGTAINVTETVWVLQDTYEGQNFFNNWTFWTGPDPTHGLVHFVDQETAFDNHYAYVTPDNQIIMQGDNSTFLPLGTNRSAVRIQSNNTYNGGLFILDLNRAPWGCGVWPAFWTVSASQPWPAGGEIDILEGVHDNIHNQVTWHTGPGCNLTNPGNFTGTVVGTDCDGNDNSNSGCGITDFSRVSYGQDFDAQGGGMYAMKWDHTGIAVWYFYRVSLPQDILDGVPNPDLWPVPSAALAPSGCDPFTNFVDHAIIFDITFCGDWAGNTYATTPGCPGTCQEHLQDPANFVNASWSINSLKVYRQQNLVGTVVAAAPPHVSPSSVGLLVAMALATIWLL